MNLRRFTISSVDIPFRTSFAHASAVRSQTENVFVHCEGRDGVVGVGEGCPRSYVTGETKDTARNFLETHKDDFMRLGDAIELHQWIEAHAVEIDAAPAAFCAAELALLDLFGQRSGSSLETLLGVRSAGPLAISAVYGASGDLKFGLQTGAFGLLGMRTAKLKLSGVPEKDCARAARLARRGPVRLDANNMFATSDAAIAALLPLKPWVWAVEEPVGSRDWPALARIRDATGLEIICDESLISLADLRAMPEGCVPNLRVSKLGGLIRALKVLQAATKEGRKVIVGAQVGETSVLARAGLTLAWAAGPKLVGCEIGYGRWLLQHDIASPSIGFGWRGKLRAESFAERGGTGLRPTMLPHQLA
jgi:L-alanine-DL-glutamate epimerase-like enolase superfamily enzyme